MGRVPLRNYRLTATGIMAPALPMIGPEQLAFEIMTVEPTS